MFFLLYRHANDGVFDDFPKISDHLPKISKDFPKLFRRPDEPGNVPEHFPKISEDFRRLPKTFEEDTNLISMKSSINSRLRLWEINHSCPGCSFYEFYEWYIFQ